VAVIAAAIAVVTGAGPVAAGIAITSISAAAGAAPYPAAVSGVAG